MIGLFINSTDRTDDLEEVSLDIKNELQERADTCSFEIFRGTKPAEDQDVKVYTYDYIESHSSDQIVLKGRHQENFGRFFAGQELFLDIQSDGSYIEKATVDSYDEDTRTITLTTAPIVSMSEDDKVGVLEFGGVISRVKDKNLVTTSNLFWDVVATDYVKIFNSKLVSGSWQSKDSRYIINDFVNSTVNYNQVVDNLSYEDNAAIQAEWTESGDGSNPTVDTSDYLEAESSGVFAWTNSGGTATWEGTPSSVDVSDLTGTLTGTPTRGSLMLWCKTSSQSNITTLKARIGSDSSNYAEVTFDLTDSTDWQYLSTDLADASITGTPDWEALDYAAIVIAEVGNGTIMLNGLRINARNSFTLYNVDPTVNFNDFRSPFRRPFELVQAMAKTFNYIAYIDYERDIVFKDVESIAAPFDVDDTSHNINDLKIEVDKSQFGNRVLIIGGEYPSSSRYSQVVEGDNAVREWILKAKFLDLEILLDDGSDTDTTEGGTDTTTIVATGHGLSVGDHITNRTRGNAVREVLTVSDPNTFTVREVPSQTSGDTFSKFTTTQTSGIEGPTDETTVDYLQNSNEKSVRAGTDTETLLTGEFLRFEYNERLKVQFPYQDAGSIAAMKVLGLFGDGVKDLDPIEDSSIQDITTAIQVGQAKVDTYKNALINGTFRTPMYGLRAGQTIVITDTTRGINENTYLIQSVTAKQVAGEFHDYFEYSVKFGTTLFGYIEFFQKLLAQREDIDVNADELTIELAVSLEEITLSDVNVTALGGIKKATQNEVVTCDDSNLVTTYSGTWEWEPHVGAQPLDTRWNLFPWG